MRQRINSLRALIVVLVLSSAYTAVGQQYPLDPVQSKVDTNLFKTPSMGLRPSEEGTSVAVFGGASVYNQADDNPKEDLSRYAPNVGDFPFLKAQSIVREVAGCRVGYTFDPSTLSFINDGSDGFLVIPRVELELMYAPYETKGSLTGSTLTNMSDKLKINSIVASALGSLHFRVTDWFEPYVGGGVGGAWMQVDSERLSFANAGVGDLLRGQATTYVLTAQGFAGLEFHLPGGWGIFTEYKYLHYFDPTFQLDQHDLKLGDIGQHIIIGGLRYSF